MAISETKSTRAPRGSRPVSQAFMVALEGVPESSRAAVAKAALAMIRDELRVQRGTMKRTAAGERKGIAAKRKAKTGVATAAAVKKRRGRKPADSRAGA